MSSATLTVRLPERHPAQCRVVDGARRFNVLACGRRWGKSTLGIDLLIDPALDGYPTAYFAPTYKMMAEIWRETRRAVSEVAGRVQAAEHRLELRTSGVIDMWSLDSPDVARGRKYKRIIVDEAAMVPGLDDVWQMILRPTLADYAGDAWFLSTPKGRGFFHTAYEWGQAIEHPEWASWQMPTAANPYIAPDEIEAMRGSMPERTYQQEILAAFLDDAGGVFRRVRDAAIADPAPLLLPRTYVAGLDWGKSQDFTFIVVKDTHSGAYVDYDRFNQIDWDVQRQRVAAMVRKWNVTTVLAERNSIGDPNIEALQRDGVPVQGFTTTNATKNHIIEQLALNIETRATTFPATWTDLISELQAYEMERLPSGVMRYGAPSGMHDDGVIAAALADEAAAIGVGQTGTFDYRRKTWKGA